MHYDSNLLKRNTLALVVAATTLLLTQSATAGELCQRGLGGSCDQPSSTLTTNDKNIDTELGSIITTDLTASNAVSGASVTATGTVSGATLTDGVASLSGGNLSTVGTVQGNTLTDGVATLNGGNLSGAVGITASGTVRGGTLTDGVASLSGGNLSTTGTVQGNTLTDGVATLNSGNLSNTINITASGTIRGGTLTDGVASLSGGNLSTVGTVQGNTLTDGVATLNSGNLSTTGTVAGGTVNAGALGVTNNATVGGALDVTGLATLDGGVSVNGGATINDGATILDGNTRFAVDAAGVEITATDTVTTGAISISDGAASVTVDNGVAVHGLVVGTSSTTLSGGSSSTTLLLDDDGAHLDKVLEMGSNRITNVSPGVDPADAVNVAQLERVRGRIDRVEDKAMKGIAIANAMPVLLPDPSKVFRLTFGAGFASTEQAIGLSGAGRVTENAALYFGVGSDTAFDEVGGKVGISYQW